MFLVSSINKTDCHDITEILLKVALNTVNQPNKTNITKVQGNNRDSTTHTTSNFMINYLREYVTILTWKIHKFEHADYMLIPCSILICVYDFPCQTSSFDNILYIPPQCSTSGKHVTKMLSFENWIFMTFSINETY